MANTDEGDNRSRPQGSEPEGPGNVNDKSTKETTAVVDEYGEPLTDDPH
jgi:hypothetical protein